ncbi:hypothetical protein [Garicola koreensis]|uniref:Asparagine synthetase domain-containing protein n=1 Tax=Garicola koreensis TaxID=1262554 RepID=A0A7W5TTP7_9MICC|nr:hypothetical protein [Garicola koreensis]MBB3667593.1 hypothetical protein [Garicola koreensis]
MIKTDVTGQEVLYFYRAGPRDWAVSNSFMLLVSEVSRRVNLTFYVPAALNFHLKEGKHIGEQLVSHKTLAEEVRIVPAGHEIIVDRSTGDASVRASGFFQRHSLGHEEGYEEVLLRYLERGAGLIDAFGRCGLRFNLNLSGGYDSRLVLALSLLGEHRESVSVSSLPSKPDDFAVASALCRRFDLSLNSPSRQSPVPTLGGVESIRLYLLSCAGTYLPFYPVNRHSPSDKPEVSLTGDQPSGVGFLAGKAKFNGGISKIASDIGDALAERPYGGAVREDFLSLFSDLEVEPDNPAAPLAFYAGVRSRHHSGRSWYKSLGSQILCTPLVHSDMLGLDIRNALQGHLSVSAAYASKRRFFADAFSAIGGWALEEPFETPERAFEADMLDNSPFRGSVKIVPKRLEVFGSVSSMYERPRGDMYGIDIDVWQGNSEVKRNLDVVFKRAKTASLGDVFTQADIAAAEKEVGTDRGLSHQSRRLAHVVAVDTVKSVMDSS